MEFSQKLTSARFLRPEDLERLGINEEGILLNSPRKNRNLFGKITGALVAGLLLSLGAYYCLYEQGVAPHPNVQMLRVASFIESAVQPGTEK